MSGFSLKRYMVIRYFIKVYTVCLDKNNLQRKKENFIQICILRPLNTSGHPKSNVSNQKSQNVQSVALLISAVRVVFYQSHCYIIWYWSENIFYICKAEEGDSK